jgi:hypothetical protein
MSFNQGYQSQQCGFPGAGSTRDKNHGALFNKQVKSFQGLLSG